MIVQNYVVSPLNSSHGFVKCSNCEFLNSWNKSIFKYNCIGQCKKFKEYCNPGDGCTFGKKGLNNLGNGMFTGGGVGVY